MTSPLYDVSCASFPHDYLGVLAEVRCVSGVRVGFAGDRAWVRWVAGDEQVLRRVLPIPGVQLYEHRDGRWFRHGHHLPAFEVPESLDYRPLPEVLTPAPMRPAPVPPWDRRPVMLGLVPDGRPRPATAMTCDLAALTAWADGVPQARLAGLRAVHRQGRILLRGTRLPLLSAGERFCGNRVLVPMGARLEPSVPESAVLLGLGLSDDEILLVRAQKAEVVALPAFEPLTRAGLRLACAGGKR